MIDAPRRRNRLPRATTSAIVVLAAVCAVVWSTSAWADAVEKSIERPRGVVSDCAKGGLGGGQGHGNLSAWKSAWNLVVGPLAMVGGAAIPGGYHDGFHGNKFPLYVLAGHRVTLSLTRGTRGRAGLAYGPLPQGDVGVGDAHRVITLIACRRGEYSPNLGGPARRASFWAGGVVADGPRCVPLLIWVDNERVPRRRVIHLGVADCG
jgi:hypothetical protein